MGVKIEKNNGERDATLVELRRLHDSWIAANLVADVEWLRANVHPDLVMYNNNGSNYNGIESVVKLWQGLQALAQAAAKQSTDEGGPSMVLDDTDVLVSTSGDLGTVSYQARWIADFGAAGKVDETSRGTEVYTRTPDGWKMSHFHASPLKDVAIPAAD